MERWRGLTDIPGDWGRCVITIGVFDGVHRGHQRLIAAAQGLARQRGIPSVVMTFDPHPAEVVRPGSHPAQLTTLPRRAELIEELGVDVLCVLPFTPELSRLPADEFVHEVLVDQLHVAAIVVGENFRFGYRAAGDIDLLRQLGSRFGFDVEAATLLAEQTVTFSSTYIRACIAAGDMAAATAALGRPHRVEGIVVRGDQRGRELGFPTANVATVSHAAIPADGIYAGLFYRADHPEQSWRAAISVGTNPTFSGRQRRIEAYLLDFDHDIYGERVAVDFTHRLRSMVRFDATEQLIQQMHADVVQVRELFPSSK